MKMTDAASRNLLYSALIRQTIHAPAASAMYGTEDLKCESTPRPSPEGHDTLIMHAASGGGDERSRPSRRLSG